MLGISDHVFDAHNTFNMASLEHVPFVQIMKLCIISRLVYASTQVYKSCIQNCSNDIFAYGKSLNQTFKTFMSVISLIPDPE